MTENVRYAGCFRTLHPAIVVFSTRRPGQEDAEFDAWLAKELHIFPLWTCPVKSTRPIGAYPLYRPESEFVVDFGFYATWDLEDQMGPYFYNKKIGKKLVEYDGLRCLYSATFYDREQFWSIYDKQAYDQVKANIERPDPFEPGRFGDGTYLITIGR